MTSWRSFASTNDLINQAAALWSRHLQLRPAHKPFLLALSGGRTARSLFRALASRHPPQDFDQVHFFWADERCVPPDHAESNFAIAQQEIFSPLRIPAELIHRIRGELPPPEAAQQAEQELRTLTRTDLPSLDFVLLGMGEDGHVASLFADHIEPPNHLFYPVLAPKPPPQRVTMSHALLEAAQHVLTLVSGPGKASALDRCREHGELPLGKLVQARSQTDVWSDF